MLGYVNKGMANVQVDYVAPAPLNGDDTRFLMASLNNVTDLDGGRGLRGSPSVMDTSSPVQLRGSQDGTVSLADMASDLVTDIFSYADTTPEQQDDRDSQRP